eukprot:m.112915 g.112915  ORF g.112915 m.112915 type:complete len:707 (-) comp15426_c0_seq1:29-2149(-)
MYLSIKTLLAFSIVLIQLQVVAAGVADLDLGDEISPTDFLACQGTHHVKAANTGFALADMAFEGNDTWMLRQASEGGACQLRSIIDCDSSNATTECRSVLNCTDPASVNRCYECVPANLKERATAKTTLYSDCEGSPFATLTPIEQSTMLTNLKTYILEECKPNVKPCHYYTEDLDRIKTADSRLTIPTRRRTNAKRLARCITDGVVRLPDECRVSTISLPPANCSGSPCGAFQLCDSVPGTFGCRCKYGYAPIGAPSIDCELVSPMVAMRFEVDNSTFPTLVAEVYAAALTIADVSIVSSSYSAVDIVVPAIDAEELVETLGDLEPPLKTLFGTELPQSCGNTTWTSDGVPTCKIGLTSGSPCDCSRPFDSSSETETILIVKPTDTVSCEALNVSIEDLVFEVVGDDLGMSYNASAGHATLPVENAQEAVDRVESTTIDGPCELVFEGLHDDVIVCFPPTALITMADGTKKTMEQIAVGDMVVCFERNGTSRPCPVTLLGHKEANQATYMTVLHYKVGESVKSIAMTPAHFVFQAANAALDTCAKSSGVQGSYVAARDVAPGDWLLHYNETSGCFMTAEVVDVDLRLDPGFYNPAVETGSYVVDDVRVSVYYDLVPHAVWDALARPFVSEINEAERGIAAVELPDGLVPEFEAMKQVLDMLMQTSSSATQAALQQLVVEVAVQGIEYTLEETQQRLQQLFLTNLV